MTSVDIEPGIYEHFKGQSYEVFGTARHSDCIEGGNESRPLRR